MAVMRHDLSENNLSPLIHECTDKTTLKEQGGLYVGLWATPTYTSPLLAVDLFSVDSYMDCTKFHHFRPVDLMEDVE
jgi:hypothetical protein